MFSFLDLVSPLPRSKVNSLNPATGSGTTKNPSQNLSPVKPPAATYAMRQFISANTKNIPGSPLYYRRTAQTETFSIEQGTIENAVGGDILVGQTNAAQPGQYHNFVGTEPLQVANVTPEEDKADEVFFRNLYSYMDDCEKHKRGVSPFQALMFMTAADTHLTLPVIRRGISKMIGFFGGAIVGEWFLGFGKGYPEHADGVELDDMREMSEK